MRRVDLCLFIFLWLAAPCFAEENVITIYCGSEIGVVNEKVFGNNLIGYDDKFCADNGAGIWDPLKDAPVEEAVALAKEAGVAVMRFPGGCGAHNYNWKNAVGKGRKHFLYGLDEFLKTCKALGAEAIITISYFEGNESDAADLVEYLNAPGDVKHPWAALRAKNGQREPYGVKYFEIGNEDWHGNHRNIKMISPGEYAKKYLKYYDAMRSVDPSVKIGVILNEPSWDKNTLEIIKDRVDFGIIHTYPSPAVSNAVITNMKAGDVFKEALGPSILNEEARFRDALKALKENAGRDIPLAVTEYNGGFIQDDPVPYRHCLGTALINAELLAIFMKPKYNVLMANYWDFCNEYWGMVANGFDGTAATLYNPYYERPNFYVFKMYHEHFGGILLPVAVRCGSYGEGMSSVPYLSVNAGKSKDGNKIYVMVLNKNMDEAISAALRLEGVTSFQKADTWILNGPGIDATNEKDRDTVKIRHESLGVKSSPFKFTFEPHSLTAIEIEKTPKNKDAGNG